MHPLTEQLATIMASTDGVPRLVRQTTALFLVTPPGDVWRIFDSDDPNGESRHAPGTNPRVNTRVFIGSGAKPSVKLYLFGDDEPRTIAAERLYNQLLAARQAP